MIIFRHFYSQNDIHRETPCENDQGIILPLIFTETIPFY